MGFSSFNEDEIFAGYRMEEFTFKGHDAKIVFPNKANEARFWIWRARFWGHEPQVDKALLEKGFHLVYVDVAGMWGNNEAVDLWNDFYLFVTEKYQLNSKAVIEGMSRGGLIVYNWTFQNTEKVACIYVDAPAMGFTSWPGPEGDKELWDECIKTNGLTPKKAKKYKDVPLEKAKIIADAEIPVLHVCGDADKVVPYKRNTGKFAKKLKRAGGEIEIIIKKGVGHHPHSLPDPKPIAGFILDHTLYKTSY